MRILITGSRTWTDVEVIKSTLSTLHLTGSPTLVSGACPNGADAIAEEVAHELGWEVEQHPANWKKYGKWAGPKRNAEMVNLGADVCIAFIQNNSKGATMTADLAEKAGIPTWRVRA